MDFSQMLERPRRLRGNPLIRSMVRETRVSKSSLIYPMFVRDGKNILEPIPSLDGQMRCSVARLGDIPEDVAKAGVNNVKEHYPELYLITDVCMCEYTSHGHCGVLCGHEVDNDKTLPLIAKTALSHVQAGADMVAPSDMMDGRVLAIRQELDKNGFVSTPIMSYAVKYSSAFYGPFREAAGSAPSFGDRKGYQMDFHNRKEALKEAALDVREGADILMVKPAMSYLDIVREVADNFDLPVAAYSVSGEYAMIKAAAKAGLIDEAAVACEAAASVFRAGAGILLTYYAKELAKWIDEGRIG